MREEDRAYLASIQQDAERYRRLCNLVEFGSWSVAILQIVDGYGNLEREELSGTETMNAMLDSEQIGRESYDCARAMELAREARK